MGKTLAKTKFCGLIALWVQFRRHFFLVRAEEVEPDRADGSQIQKGAGQFSDVDMLS